MRTSPRWIVPRIRLLATSSYISFSIKERGNFSPSPIRRSYTAMLSRSPSVRSHSSQMASTMRLLSHSSMIPYHRLLTRRDKLTYLGVYLAYRAPDVSFEQPTPVVVLDALDIAQRCFHGVADVVEPRKQLLHILMLVHHAHLLIPQSS